MASWALTGRFQGQECRTDQPDSGLCSGPAWQAGPGRNTQQLPNPQLQSRCPACLWKAQPVFWRTRWKHQFPSIFLHVSFPVVVCHLFGLEMTHHLSASGTGHNIAWLYWTACQRNAGRHPSHSFPVNITKVTRLHGGNRCENVWRNAKSKVYRSIPFSPLHRRHPDVWSSKAESPYLLQSLASASWGMKMSAVGMQWVPRVSDSAAVALMPLLKRWTAAAAGRSWMGCQLVMLWHCWSLLQPQESRCQPARSVPGHGARCLSGYHPYSTPGWSHCGHRSQRNWWWWLRGCKHRGACEEVK